MTMRSIEIIDEYVAASGGPSSPRKRRRHSRVRSALDKDYCRPGCAGCLGSCPHDVPIAEILRYRLYFNCYGEEKRAIALYGKLPASCSAARCAFCHAPCEATCPHRLAIRSKLLEAHMELTV